MRLLQIICPDCSHANRWDANAHDVLYVTLSCPCGAYLHVRFRSKRFLDAESAKEANVVVKDARSSE